MGKTVVFVRSCEIYNDSRSTKEILALSEFGYNVVVLGWDRDGAAQQKCDYIFGKYKNVELHFYKERIPNGIGFKNIRKLFGWFKWIKTQLKLLEDIHIIHCCDFDTGYCIRKYAKKNNIKYIYDIFDYYIDSHSIPLIMRWYIENQEIKVINDADAVLICTEERKKQISKSKPKLLQIIYNSPDIDSVQCEETDLIYDYVYCGGLLTKRLIDKILDSYSNNSDLKFLFAGGGESKLVDKARELSEKYENFEYVGQISYNEVLMYEQKSICLSAIYNPSYRNHKFCAPNKFYESLAFGKPVIVCKGTGIDEIVDNHNLGISIEYEANMFYDAIRMIKNDSSLQKKCYIEGKHMYNNLYNWNYMKKRLENLYLTI